MSGLAAGGGRPGPLRRPAEGTSSPGGRLFGIGVGPGDPELMTLKAVRLIGEADTVAWPTARPEGGVALAAAAPFLRPDQERLPLVYPVTAGGGDAPGYRARMRAFYDETAAMLAMRLERGESIALLCEGDPFLYGSFIYWHARLAGRFPTVTVPGVSSVTAAPVAAGLPLCRQDDVAVIIPGTLPEEVIVERLRMADAAVIIKLGRAFGRVKRALAQAGRLERAVYVERATSAGECIAPAAAVEPARAPYFSIVIVPSETGE